MHQRGVPEQQDLIQGLVQPWQAKLLLLSYCRTQLQGGDMPGYSVWYRNNPAPLEFVTAYRSTELQIVEHILAQEKIAMPAGDTPGVKELIAMHALAPVRYTEDESEANTIG
jgi:hypothetical protein